MTILDKIKKTDIKGDPFPHIVLYDAIDSNLCDTLIAELPTIDVVTGGRSERNNERFNYSAAKSLSESHLSQHWRQFLLDHLSPAFYQKLFSLFSDHIRQYYPLFEEKIARIDKIKIGTRGVNSYVDCDVLLDAQIAVNTPVTKEETSVRTVHVDMPEELFAGLLYLRLPGDNSEGGNLELYKFSKGKRVFFNKIYGHPKYIERFASVPYKKNALVLFLNTPDSLHGVTIRRKTDVPRWFFNIIGEVRKPLFNINSYQETLIDTVRRSPSAIVNRVLRKFKS